MTSTTTDRRLSVNAGAAVKVPVKTATTAAITLSGLQVIDGYQTVDGDRVLVKNQADATQNGIYLAHAGAWTYDADWAASPYNVKKGTLVFVTDGATTFGFWRVTSSDPLTPGTSSFAFAFLGFPSSISVPVSLANGGTGGTSAITALDNLTTRGADIASAASINLDNATGDLPNVTGTITITQIVLGAGKWRTVRFTGSLTLTNGASLDLGGANIQTFSGLIVAFRGYDAGVVRLVTTFPAVQAQNLGNTTQALVDGANIAWDASLGAVATVTIAGNRTMNAPTNLRIGGRYVLIVTQDATGGRSLTWNAVFKAQGNDSMPQPVQTASKFTVFMFTSPDGVNLDLETMVKPVGGSQVFTASGTFTTPTNTLTTSQFKFTVVAGGGSGASSGATGAGGSGGNSGATAIYYVSGLTPAQACTVTIGAGGAAPAAGTNNGNAGGNSSVIVGATTVTANGGAGGQASVSAQAANPAAAATAANGTINASAAQGAIGGPYSGALFGGGQGAPSSFGGGGAAGPAGNNGQAAAANAYGAGGGGAGTHATLNFAGGAGAQGIIIVEWVI